MLKRLQQPFLLIIPLFMFLAGVSGDKMVGGESPPSVGQAVQDTLYMEDFVISTGIIECHSTDYSLSASMGELVVGDLNSADYSLSQGFSIEDYIGSCCETAGDANDDDQVNVGDAVFLINYIFKGGPAPTCMDQGDANCDHEVNVGDAVYVINYVFRGGPEPCCP